MMVEVDVTSVSDLDHRSSVFSTYQRGQSIQSIFTKKRAS